MYGSQSTGYGGAWVTGATSGYAQADVGVSVPQPPITQAIDRVKEANAHVVELIARARSAADSLTGCVPDACQTAASKPPTPSGRVYELSECISVTHDLLGELSAQITRLTSL